MHVLDRLLTNSSKLHVIRAVQNNYIEVQCNEVDFTFETKPRSTKHTIIVHIK